MTPTEIALLRPMDTARMGWRPSYGCDHCRMGVDFRPPADVMRCTWLYVMEITRCHRCRRVVAGMSFWGRVDGETGMSSHIADIERAPDPER